MIRVFAEVSAGLDAGGFVQLLELGVCYRLRSLKGLEHLCGAVRYNGRPREDLVAGGQVDISDGIRPRRES